MLRANSSPAQDGEGEAAAPEPVAARGWETGMEHWPDPLKMEAEQIVLVMVHHSVCGGGSCAARCNHC